MRAYLLLLAALCGVLALLPGSATAQAAEAFLSGSNQARAGLACALCRSCADLGTLWGRPPAAASAPPAAALCAQVPPKNTDTSGSWNGTLSRMGDAMQWNLDILSGADVTMAHIHQVILGGRLLFAAGESGHLRCRCQRCSLPPRCLAFPLA